MKNIIILEGIASSGKTTIEKLLVERLKDAVILSESDTLMPVIDNADISIARAHLEKQVATICDCSAMNVIVDRFHLTHAFRMRTGLDAFSNTETELQQIGNVLVVLFTIDPDQIKDRIAETILHLFLQLLTQRIYSYPYANPLRPSLGS